MMNIHKIFKHIHPLLLAFIVLHSCKVNPQDPYKTSNAKPEEYKGMKLVWQDEFNTDGTPKAKFWTYEHGFVRNNELQWYLPENAVCDDGRLLITAKKETIANPAFDPSSDNWKRNRSHAQYTSSCLITKGLKEFKKYGLYEIRARIDTTSGSWPAIWILGTEKRWPDAGEIDIMEFYRINGNPTILANAAWGGRNGQYVSWDASRKALDDFLSEDPDWAQKYHVWKMIWDETAINLYLDGALLNEIPLDSTLNKDGFNPFRDGENYYLLLNLAIGSNGGEPDNDQFPISYEIDYVRVYEFD